MEKNAPIAQQSDANAPEPSGEGALAPGGSPWRAAFVGVPAFIATACLGATFWETRRDFALFQYFTAENAEGLSILKHEGFREAYKFSSLYVDALGFGAVALLAPFLLYLILKRRRPELGCAATVSKFQSPFLLGFLGLGILLHFAGFRHPNFTAAFDDYRTLWKIWHIGIFAAIPALLALIFVRLWKSEDVVAAMAEPGVLDEPAEEEIVDAESAKDAPKSPPTAFQRFAFWGALAAVLLYAVCFSTMASLRHASFHTATHDLGLYDQMLWNVSRGDGFRVTTWLDRPVYGDTENGLEWIRYNFVAEHFMPILYLVAPLYRVWASPVLILVLQSIALAAAAWMLFLFARGFFIEKIGSIDTSDNTTTFPQTDLLALALALGFLLHPSIHEANIKDFHTDGLGPFFAFAALWAWRERRLLPYFLASALFLMCKEDAALMFAAFGAFQIVMGDWRWGLPTMIGSMVYFFGVGGYIDENVRGGANLRHLWRYHHLVFPLHTDAEILEGVMPEGVVDLARGFLADPWGALNPDVRLAEIGGYYAPILSHERVRSLLLLGVPVGFAFLRAPRTWLLLAVPVASAMLSNWDHNYRLRMHYGLASVTWIYAASVFGLGCFFDQKRRERLAAMGRTLRPRLVAWIVYIVVASVLLAFYFGRAPLMREFDPVAYTVDDHVAAINEALDLIPDDASLSASNRIGPHVTRRRNIMLFPELSYVEDPAAIDPATDEPIRTPVDWIVVNTLDPPWPMTLDNYRFAVENILRREEYGVWTTPDNPTGLHEGILLLKRGHDASANAAVIPRLDITAE